MLITILVVHVFLAIGIIVGMAARYYLAIKNKDYPLSGRTAVFGATTGLVISGVALAIIGKLPISNLCLDSLGIVIGLLALELGLQKLSTKLATENYRSK